MSFILRPAQEIDLEQILEIYNQEILTGLANWNETPKSAEVFATWYEQMIGQGNPVWIALDQHSNQVAGYAYYAQFRPIQGFRHSVEHSVFISPRYSRQGLGRALLQQLIETAKTQNVHVMVAAIDSENHGSIRLHEQLDFIQCGYMAEVGQKFGQWRDLVFMQLLFKAARF